MKILVYGINYSPELTGIGKYTGEMVEWMAQQGHDVRVITAPPYYPQWKVNGSYSSWRYRREEGDALVWRCPLYVPEQPSTLKRLLHLGSFALSSFSRYWRNVAGSQIALSAWCRRCFARQACACWQSFVAHVRYCTFRITKSMPCWG